MIPSDHFFVGGGAAESVITPIAAVLLMLAVALILLLPRRYVLLPLLLGVFLVPTGNVLVLAGFHMMPVRLLATTGWLRLAFTKTAPGKGRFAGGCSKVDRALLGCYIAIAIAVLLQWMDMAAVANQLGALLSTLGMYLLLRQLIRDQENIFCHQTPGSGCRTKCFVYDHQRITLHNLIGMVIGGVQTSPLVREGRVRAQGAFQHAILPQACSAQRRCPLSLWLFKTRR